MLAYLAIILPLLWLLAWIVPKVWTSGRGANQTRLPDFEKPKFWTEIDANAIQIVETFRKQIHVDRNSIMDSNRYLEDAGRLASQLSAHYHKSEEDEAFHPITLVEVLSVIHLASEDIESWTIKNLPGSNMITVGHFAKMSDYARYVDNSQKLVFLIGSIAKPMKLLMYPLWRKSTAVTDELQNEVAQLIYQQYLRTVGFYLIEMFSGRLRAGSKEYRDRFGRWAQAIHHAGGKKDLIDSLACDTVVIAVMGQVKAGKSSLINAILGNNHATTNVLPETRQVQRYAYTTPNGVNVELLDTPGYSEADVSRRQRHEVELATEAADIVLLVMAANSPAKDADVRMVKDIQHYYRERTHLKPPKIVGVLTHIDLLRPATEWKPPYDWRNPRSAKERSMAEAVAYSRELLASMLWITRVFTRGRNMSEN